MTTGKFIKAALVLCLLAAPAALAAEKAKKGKNKGKGKFPSSVEQQQKQQYKKQNRDQITKIATGRAEEAAAYFREYLDRIPTDGEAWYGLAAASSVLGEQEAAERSIEKAVQTGIPAERFIAGPRNFFKPGPASPARPRPIQGPIFSVNDRAARIWMRCDKPGTLLLEVKGGGTDPLHREAEIGGTSDYTAVITLDGLEPDTVYEVPGGVFRTFPEQGKPGTFTLGFGGGAGYTPWFERMWTTLEKEKFQAFLLLGDNVYIDTPKVVETQRYCYYRRQSQPEFRSFAAKTPIFAVWDDHDFGDNDCEGGPEVDQPAWKPDVLEVFKQNWANPYYGGGDEHPGIWFDAAIGDVDMFFLDTRYYRSFDKTKESRSMLGPVQKQWLKDQLVNSKATFKLLCTSVPFAPGAKGGSIDTWDGFVDERAELFDFIAVEKIEGVVILAADRHRSDAWKIERPGAYDLYEFMSSKLTNLHTHPVLKGSLFGYNQACSFGRLDIDTTADDPELVYTIKDIDGKTVWSMTLKRSQLEFP